jgi:hypothetical protein
MKNWTGSLQQVDERKKKIRLNQKNNDESGALGQAPFSFFVFFLGKL